MLSLFWGIHCGGTADVRDGLGAGDDVVGAQVDPLALPRLHHGAKGDEGRVQWWDKSDSKGTVIQIGSGGHNYEKHLYFTIKNWFLIWGSMEILHF